MPYAQSHYPFENKKEFEDAFPADFIAEGTDQTRGWFYTLLVLSSALFNKAPFKVMLQIWYISEKAIQIKTKNPYYLMPNFNLTILFLIPRT